MRSDKEIEFLPMIQRFESLNKDVKLLIEKLEQIENDIEELKKEILDNVI